MAQLMGIVYDAPQQARAALEALRQEGVPVIDAVLASKNAWGEVVLEEGMDGGAPGSIAGALWGSLLGLVIMATGGPVAGVAGAVCGAAAGASLASLDGAIDRGFLREIARSLDRSRAGLFLLAPDQAIEQLAPALGRHGGVIFYSAVPRSVVTTFRAVLEARAPMAQAPVPARGQQPARR